MRTLLRRRSFNSRQPKRGRVRIKAMPLFVTEPLEARRLLNALTFATALYHAGNEPISVAVGDFAGDGNADLAVADLGTPDTVSVLLGNGDGTFQAAINYAAGNTPTSVTVGDFNGDGTADLAVANGGDWNGTAYLNCSVSVLLGNGISMRKPRFRYRKK